MVPLQRIKPRFTDRCVVAATGPSLTQDVADLCRGIPVIAVNDAWRLLPFADVLYAADADWWDHHRGCPEFAGERWSSHDLLSNRKFDQAARYDIHLVRGAQGEGFSTDPRRIHYGRNSGFQAVNLAILFGAKRILLVGFDMWATGGKRHFFGDHPDRLHNEKSADELTRYFGGFLREFDGAARTMPPGVTIINCTPGSALRCFPSRDLATELGHSL